MKENVLYVKLDENKVITGFFKCLSTTPKYKAVGCEFTKEDFVNAIVLDAVIYENNTYRKVDYDDIVVGYSTFNNGVFIQNKNF